jgi:hypothetical protein
MALPHRRSPELGMSWSVPQFATGAAVAVQAENSAIQETDPAPALASANLATIAGHVDSSRQLWDRGRSAAAT